MVSVHKLLFSCSLYIYYDIIVQWCNLHKEIIENLYIYGLKSIIISCRLCERCGRYAPDSRGVSPEDKRLHSKSEGQGKLGYSPYVYDTYRVS